MFNKYIVYIQYRNTLDKRTNASRYYWISYLSEFAFFVRRYCFKTKRMRFVCNLRMREVTKCKMLIQMCSQTDTLLIAGGQTRPKNWHLPTSCPLLPCWQGRGTLITLDGTLELRAAWNNCDIQTPSCPRLQMLTWVCGQGDSGQGRTSCPELSRAESGEWRVESMIHCPRVSTECQFTNIQPQLGPGAGASRMRGTFLFSSR